MPNQRKPNFAYTRFLCSHGKWCKLQKGVFYSRALSCHGCGLALKRAVGPHTAAGDIYLGYGYMHGSKDLVRIVYAPGAKILESFNIDEGQEEEYKHSKSQAMVEVSKIADN